MVACDGRSDTEVSICLHPGSRRNRRVRSAVDPFSSLHRLELLDGEACHCLSETSVSFFDVRNHFETNFGTRYPEFDAEAPYLS